MSVIDILKERQGILSDKAFAKKLNISPQYICDVYFGRRRIGLKRAVKIGRQLGDNAEMLLVFEIMNNLLKEAKCKYKVWIEL